MGDKLEYDIYPVLDSGYVECITHWGSDESIIEAARMSTGKGFQGWGDAENPGDEKLLRYLYTHKHMTPFEMAGMIVEVQAPIMVFREWMRHRTQSFNETSARYTELPDLFYLPSIERLMNGKQSTTNKQASAEGFTEEDAKQIQLVISCASKCARKDYKTLLANGVSREIARLVLPVNQYSKMRASANLRNWLAFLELRTAEGAQQEIREYANVVAKFVEQHFPRTYALYKGD